MFIVSYIEDESTPIAIVSTKERGIAIMLEDLKTWGLPPDNPTLVFDDRRSRYYVHNDGKLYDVYAAYKLHEFEVDEYTPDTDDNSA